MLVIQAMTELAAATYQQNIVVTQQSTGCNQDQAWYQEATERWSCLLTFFGMDLEINEMGAEIFFFNNK
jgi:hypothetical protein